MNAPSKKKLSIDVVLLAVLLLALWIGWRDFDPNVPQYEVREGIREAIRRVVQIAVQFVIALVILVYFVREFFAWRRTKAERGASDA